MEKEQSFAIIRSVLEKEFELGRKRGKYAFSYPTEFIPLALIDPHVPSDDEGYSFWKPIPSTVTELEIMELEMYLKNPLPESYKYFLTLYHFIDLHLGNTAFRFFDNKPGTLVHDFKKVVETFYEFAIERNIIPFAHYYYDWGVAAFIAEKNDKELIYHIGILDHDDGYEQIQYIAKDLLELFDQFEKQLDELATNLSGATSS